MSPWSPPRRLTQESLFRLLCSLFQQPKRKIFFLGAEVDRLPVNWIPPKTAVWVHYQRDQSRIVTRHLPRRSIRRRPFGQHMPTVSGDIVFKERIMKEGILQIRRCVRSRINSNSEMQRGPPCGGPLDRIKKAAIMARPEEVPRYPASASPRRFGSGSPSCRCQRRSGHEPTARSQDA